MTRIGFQGEVGGNAEQAAWEIAAHLGLAGVEWFPLVSSAGVIAALREGRIDYGVFAVKNNLGGTVAETAEAVRGVSLRLMGAVTLDIHHCLFKKPGVPDVGLRFVASHIQALKQTEATRDRTFPQLEALEAYDTALAARWLARGMYADDVAVLAKMSAGLDNGLELVAENLEDQFSRTEFHLYALATAG